MHTIYFCCLLLQVGYLKFKKKAATQVSNNMYPDLLGRDKAGINVMNEST